MRTALQRIAGDEARHAALAWRFVRWAIDRGGPPVRAAVAAAFADALDRRLPAPDAIRDHHHGRLGREDVAELLRCGRREIVTEGAARLLGANACGRDDRQHSRVA